MAFPPVSANTCRLVRPTRHVVPRGGAAGGWCGVPACFTCVKTGWEPRALRTAVHGVPPLPVGALMLDPHSLWAGLEGVLLRYPWGGGSSDGAQAQQLTSAAFRGTPDLTGS